MRNGSAFNAAPSGRFYSITWFLPLHVIMLSESNAENFRIGS